MLLAVHVLGGGVWVGVMVFSIFVLHPGAERYFKRDTDFEDFIFTVVHGARWKVFSGIVAILASGVALSVWPGHAIVREPGWLVIYAAKIALFCVSAGSFAYVSWVLWPRRTFATPAELPAIKLLFWRVGVVMIAANATNVGLGIAAHVWRVG
ncbi:hypothetical protein DB30_05782 [Enhygromyxa salina]|uniref:Copper resistance protein D domain-containing protein n=2 Tax=Enhygromyxa salina TaxID=215803 RepID=A0A0C1ZW35_9BACT|nr:hypothetical protein DB30_05782 [Enhygromyxa salina]